MVYQISARCSRTVRLERNTNERIGKAEFMGSVIIRKSRDTIASGPMQFHITDTFTDALARLPAQEQKAAKTSAFDLQLNPSSTGLQFHRIDKSKDPNFWSVRVNRDLRIIVHKSSESTLLAYVDHHDKAYAWAERRRIETHPKTGAIQIVEVRERVEEIAPRLPFEPEPIEPVAETKPQARCCFETLTRDQLLSVGVPTDWIDDVLAADEDRFLAVADH